MYIYEPLQYMSHSDEAIRDHEHLSLYAPLTKESSLPRTA